MVQVQTRLPLLLEQNHSLCVLCCSPYGVLRGPNCRPQLRYVSNQTLNAVILSKKCGLNAVSLSDSGKVIHIHRADYGRSDSITCSQGRPAEQLQNVNCTTGPACVSLSPVFSLCVPGAMGKHCSVTASHTDYGDPCGGTYKYLQVSYSCERRLCSFFIFIIAAVSSLYIMQISIDTFCQVSILKK
uniref:SUEL-type lectin domain-containing protein n=1 Tax=Neogobius melanostomus TaxID=47308 RepID=A0A8C6SJ03_9GOBI